MGAEFLHGSGYTIGPLQWENRAAFAQRMREFAKESPMAASLRAEVENATTEEKYIGKLRRLDWILLAATGVDGSVVGGMEAEIFDDHALIGLTGVRQDVRRRGIATGLVTMMERMLLQQGIGHMITYIHPDNHKSRVFFERRGFTRIEPHRLYTEGGKYYKRIVPK